MGRWHLLGASLLMLAALLMIMFAGYYVDRKPGLAVFLGIITLPVGLVSIVLAQESGYRSTPRFYRKPEGKPNVN